MQLHTPSPALRDPVPSFYFGQRGLQRFLSSALRVKRHLFFVFSLFLWLASDQVKPSSRGTVGQDGTVYDCTQDLLLENLVLTGFGASVGSVTPGTGNSCVNRVTFRNLSMPYSGKGVYVKSNGNPCTEAGVTAQLTNILFQDVHMYKPVSLNIHLI